MEYIPQNPGPCEFSMETFAAVKGQFQSSEIGFYFSSNPYLNFFAGFPVSLYNN